jgi:hypothetical protein
MCRGLFFITGPHRPKNWNGKIESWRNYSYNHVPYNLQYMNASSISVAAKNSGLGLVYWNADSEEGESFEAWLDSPWPVSKIISESVKNYHDDFSQSPPFKHVVIDNFLETDFAEALLNEFPKFDKTLALNEMGNVGGKAVNTDICQIGPSYQRLFETLESRPFLEFISRLTGIPDLILDPSLFGGGTHENIHEQELDPHVDFNYIDSKKLHRRLNLLIYLNKDWKMDWGGAIELHSNPRDASSNQIKSFNVLFNRAIIFETNEYSWHGFPQIDLPPEERHRSRKSISIYDVVVQFPSNDQTEIVIRVGSKIFVGSKTFMRATLIEEGASSVIVDNLRLENPIKANDKTGLNLEQNSKGLPLDVFRHVNRRLVEMLKAGGYSEMKTNSQQHFGVMMLYRKVVGMEPANKTAKGYLDEIDAIYQFARKELPEELRPTSVDHFSRLLGAVNTLPSGWTLERVNQLNRYFKTGEVPADVEIKFNSEGKPVCAIFHKSALKVESNVLFIHHIFGEPRVFNWSEVGHSKKLHLVKILNP